METEKKIFELALDCVRCGSCRVIYTDRIKSMRFGKQCPPGTRYLVESFYPAGLMYLAVGLMREQFPYSPRAVEAVYSCTQCGYCQAICEGYVETKTMPVIQELRNKAVREGVGPLPGQKDAMNRLKATDNILGKPKGERTLWAKGYRGKLKDLSRGEKAPVLYFLGCQYSCNPALKDVPLATARILDAAGVSWGILGDAEQCCGYLARSLGYSDIFERYARAIVDRINKLGVEQIVTSCPECYATLKKLYPAIAPLRAEVVHLAELTHHLLTKGDLALKKNTCTVTYHDPCVLGRFCSLYEAPREVIKAIPGVVLMEMERNRIDAWCCGAGGGVKLGNREYALATGKDRVEEARSTGAEVLITSCPNCLENLQEARDENKASIVIKDIASFVSQSLVR